MGMISIMRSIERREVGKGGGFDHQLWINVVAALFYFREVNDAGNGVGKCEVWDARTHTIKFPGTTQSFLALWDWLSGEVPPMFNEGLVRARTVH